MGEWDSERANDGRTLANDGRTLKHPSAQKKIVNVGFIIV
jgi:hypothetical protein